MKKTVPSAEEPAEVQRPMMNEVLIDISTRTLERVHLAAGVQRGHEGRTSTCGAARRPCSTRVVVLVATVDWREAT